VFHQINGRHNVVDHIVLGGDSLVFVHLVVQLNVGDVVAELATELALVPQFGHLLQPFTRVGGTPLHGLPVGLTLIGALQFITVPLGVGE